MKSKYTREELLALPELSPDHLNGYVNIPKGYACKVSEEYSRQLIFNPETGHAIVYAYSETTSYGDSASDIQYNGHYNQCDEYQAE